MRDSVLSERSKFLPSDSKSVLTFAMPTIVLNHSLSLSSAFEQVAYHGSVFSWKKCKFKPPTFLRNCSCTVKLLLVRKKQRRFIRPATMICRRKSKLTLGENAQQRHLESKTVRPLLAEFKIQTFKIVFFSFTGGKSCMMMTTLCALAAALPVTQNSSNVHFN